MVRDTGTGVGGATGKGGARRRGLQPADQGHPASAPVVAGIANRLQRSPVQVLLRWGLQHGLVVLPKSTNPARIAENAALFDFRLPPETIANLDALEEGLVTGWNPRNQP